MKLHTTLAMEEINIEAIIKSKRKTIALEITDRATLVVRAPYYVSKKAINEVIEKHKKWIEKNIERKQEENKRKVEKEFVSGESFLYLGRAYRLFIVKNQKIPLVFDNAFYLEEEYKPFARELFEKWYKESAQTFIEKRLDYYSNLTGIKFGRTRITSAKRRWGSCSKEGNLCFSYRLVMAPVSVIDYVVVHELCHIDEHNHSSAFWEKVRVILPDYKKEINWLKENGYLLFL